MPDVKRTIIQVRLSNADKARVEAAATQDNRTVSAWLRAVILKALKAEEAAQNAGPKRRRPATVRQGGSEC